MKEEERALYIISVAAELAGVHPQTLRIYERKGLIDPQRTEGRSRRYSDRDIELLQHIQELTNEGVGLSGQTQRGLTARRLTTITCVAGWTKIRTSC
jgi:MerR family transcriptional regulator, heat shock protein HspR